LRRKKIRAKSVPKWQDRSIRMPPSSPKKYFIKVRWAEELTGRNSVRACVIPRRIDSIQDIALLMVLSLPYHRSKLGGKLFKSGRSTGLEPATFGITIQHSNQLSYDRHRRCRDDYMMRVNFRKGEFNPLFSLDKNYLHCLLLRL
jgi:hypothetical protein